MLKTGSDIPSQVYFFDFSNYFIMKLNFCYFGKDNILFTNILTIVGANQSLFNDIDELIGKSHSTLVSNGEGIYLVDNILFTWCTLLS